MTSTSSGGTSVIVLQFTLSLNIDVAERKVQSAINASPELSSLEPTGAAGYTANDPADAPVLHAGDHFERCAIVAGRGSCRHAIGSQALAVERRGTGEH